MPTPTYDLIASNVLSSSAASVTFSSIPATYRDLVLVMEAKDATSSGQAIGRFNGDSGTNYAYVQMLGDGSSTASFSSNVRTSIMVSSPNGTTTQAAMAICHIMDYSATDKHKTVLCRSNAASDRAAAQANRWANTAAITSFEISGMTFASGSTFYLYGIVS